MGYKIGDKVVVIGRPWKNAWKCYDEILQKRGEIVYVPHGKHHKHYGVKIEGHSNPKKSWIPGCYWLEPRYLRKDIPRYLRKDIPYYYLHCF